MPLENFAEKCHVLIADGIADLLHGAVVALEQTLGGGDTQFLEIDQRAVSSGMLEAANEIAQAHADRLRRCFEGEGLMKVLVQPLLRFGDGLIGMFSS